jgi:hypothetical protein
VQENEDGEALKKRRGSNLQKRQKAEGKKERKRRNVEKRSTRRFFIGRGKVLGCS